MMLIDVVCPIYKGEKIIENLIHSVLRQKNIEIGNMVFPITESENSDKIANIVKKYGYTYFIVKKDEFSHSLTREKAIKTYCTNNIVLMISQDINFENEYSIYNLVKNIENDVVYVYGRQIAKKKSIEHYIRKTNYGTESLVVSNDDIERMQLKAFFASDAFSAYNRDCFIKLGGYDEKHMMMNEDMYYSRKILLAGYKKKYVADAVVEHFHEYTLKRLYNRYRETGYWFHVFKEFSNYKVTSTGGQLARGVLKMALKDFNIPVLIKFIPNMTARFMGMKKGEKWNDK